jgi:3-dehydroquinate dehydratase/shikimate dehydrogenase
MTAIAIPIFLKPGSDPEALVLEAEEALLAVPSPGGMLELRCDTATPKLLEQAIDAARLPLIVTVRPTWEGGFSTRTDAQRMELWELAMELGAEYIDVELVTWEKNPRLQGELQDFLDKTGTRLILSNHHFEGRPLPPHDIPARLARLRAVKAAHLLKIAWKAESLLDAVEALRLTRDLPKKDPRPILALAMGEQGALSRLLARKFAAPFTFATAQAGKESAPGQPTVDLLLSRYRWARQSLDAPLFGVVGWPVAHSLSPHIHNAGFDATDSPGIYVPLPIQPDYASFAAAVNALRSTADLRGLSITIPHKENAFRFAKEHHAAIDAVSEKLGVLNTLVWDLQGQLTGANSDYAGALDALVTAWSGRREDVAGKRIAVLGAGGAARAVVAGLAAHGATIVLYNRTREKADALAADFADIAKGGGGKIVAADWEKLCDSCCQVYINCTPLGMHPNVHASPINPDGPSPFTPETVAFDTVYNPLNTRFLKQAAKAGATTIPGTEMFVRQAALQFERFTQKPAPIDLFRTTLLTNLKGK